MCDNMHTKRGENHQCNMYVKIHIQTFCHSFDWLPSIDCDGVQSNAFSWILHGAQLISIFRAVSFKLSFGLIWGQKNIETNSITHRYDIPSPTLYKTQWFFKHERFPSFNDKPIEWSNRKIWLVFKFQVNFVWNFIKFEVYEHQMDKCTDKPEKWFVFHQFLFTTTISIVFGLAYNWTRKNYKCHRFEFVLRIEIEFTTFYTIPGSSSAVGKQARKNKMILLLFGKLGCCVATLFRY